MKNPIDTKKTFVTALILSIALFTLPFSSFGMGAFVYRNEANIEGLYFAFGEDDGLPVSLPGLGDVSVTDTLVEAYGRETLIITRSGTYIYRARLWAGIEGSEKGTISASAISEGMGLLDLVFEFESATLFERFTIEGEIPDDPLEIEVPPDVNLFFKVREATLIEVCWPEADYCMDVDDGVPFNLMFRLRRGDLQFIFIW